MRARKLVLPDCDLDDGEKTASGEYSLTDETYATLLAKLSASNFDKTSPQLRENILVFYARPLPPAKSKKELARQQVILANLRQLKSVEVSLNR